MTTETNAMRSHASTIDHSLSSDIVIVAVGNKHDRKIFNVHKAKLSKTTFFEKNGPIPTLEQKQAQAESHNEEAQSQMPHVKRESTVGPYDADTTGTVNEDTLPKTTFSVANAPDYVITTRDHDPAAFNVLVQWLYNDPPKRIRFKQDKAMLLRTYRLALRYNAYNLQNLILQRFREYHQDYSVEFDDLKYLAHRENEDLRCPMITYLLEQVAYQITTDGLEPFLDKNKMFEETFNDNSLPIIQFALLRAISRHAEASRGALGDPAKGFGRWDIWEDGELAGRPRDAALENGEGGSGRKGRRK